tara:strand:- start:408 stop:2354 length:1947 start_codon:yes stop_codon:yes gene_type:complete
MYQLKAEVALGGAKNTDPRSAPGLKINSDSKLRMATANSRTRILDIAKNSKKLENSAILTEAYENYNHNKTTSFFQSFQQPHFEGEPGDDDSRYMVLAYDKGFKADIVGSLFEINNENDKRTTSSIETMGVGMCHLFHAWGEDVAILSLTGGDVAFSAKLNLAGHVKNIDRNKTKNVHESYLENLTRTGEDTLARYNRDHWDHKELMNTLNNARNKYNDENEDKLPIPSGYIFIKLNEVYRSMDPEKLNDEIEKLKKVCAIKHYKTLNKVSCVIHTDFGKYKEFTKIEPNDVVFDSAGYDKHLWYIKNITCGVKKTKHKIIYFKLRPDPETENKFAYYEYSNGTFTPIIEGHDLYEEVHTLNQKDCDYTDLYHHIGSENHARIKATEGSVEALSGYWYILGGVLLKSKPQNTYDVVDALTKNLPGASASRHLITIMNKSDFDIRGIKSEFDMKDPDKKKLCKSLNKILDDTHHRKNWKDDTHTYKKGWIDTTLLLSVMGTDIGTAINKVPGGDTRVPVKPKGDDKSMHYLYFNVFELKDSYKIKVGYSKKITERTNKLKKEFKNSTLVSQTYIGMSGVHCKQSEISLLSDLRNDEKFKNTVEGGQITERFIVKLDDIIEFEIKFTKFKYAVLSNKNKTWDDFCESNIQ